MGRRPRRPVARAGDDVDGGSRGFLRSVGERTRVVLASTPLERVAATGGRFDEDPPTLAWICFHVLQEYARHVGHLDIVVELAGGPTGE